MSFGTVAILGPGLIGGSLALALAERGLAEKLVIYARSDKSFPAIKAKLQQAELTTDVIKAVTGADVVVLCVPIETMAPLVKQFADSLKLTALITDVGSVKESVEKEIAPLLAGKALWIGSHPMAGSEKSGFEAARADLFDGAKVIVAYTEKTAPEAKRRADEFWQKVGGNTFQVPPFRHDAAVAHISHLPHITAAALVNVSEDDYFRAAGPGFRDSTRIAAGSPDLWKGILSENRKEIAKAVSKLIDELKKVEKSLGENNTQHLHDFLSRAQNKRSTHLKPNP
jgi:prephenate dehydrogenase